MKYFIPKDITITDSSIPEHTDAEGNVYSVWNKIDAREEEVIVSHNGSLFEALKNIYPLATYSWNDIANNETPVVTRLSDKTVITPTAVPCVKDETIVYVKDTWKTGAEDVVGKYFQYTGSTGNVDFTSIDPTSLPFFTAINNYRVVDAEPIAESNTLYWKYLGRTNRNKIVDKSYNSQSIIDNTVEEWWEFETLNPDKITIFNVEAPFAKIIIYTDDINSPLYESPITSLLDTSSLINWRTLSKYRALYTKNASWKIPFIVGTVTIRVVLFSNSSATIKVGEILEGEQNNYAITLDNIPIPIKSSGKIIELDNGDLILEDEGNSAKKYLLYTFNLLYDTLTHDQLIDKSIEMLHRRIVIEAENTDEPIFRSLVFYGFITDVTPVLTTNSTHSKISLKAQRFK